MTDVYLTGVGMHPFGRFPDRQLKDLARLAVLNALADADLTTRDIGAVYAANSLAGALTGQHQIRGQVVLRDVGLAGMPIVNVENACAGGSTALREAIMAVQSGSADTAMAVGFEKMFFDDRAKSLDALRSAADLDIMGGLGLQFPAIYAMRLKKRLADGSLTRELLALSAVKAHFFGARNPNAQFRKELTVEQILQSRPIAEPLTLLMCSSIGDGAAAVIVSRRRSDGDVRPSVRVRSSVLRTAMPDASDAGVAQMAANGAYEASSVEPSDVDVLEVHDAMAPGELFYYEYLGLCDDGEAGRLLSDGVTTLGGRHVVNPSGGLSARGHPVGASGLAQAAEIVWQLRGEAGARQVKGAQIGITHNSGGWSDGDSAVSVVHVLEGSG